MISGCSVDFFINILLTILGHLPGHIHAFYLEYVYYRNSSTDPMTRKRAPGVYSQRILQGHDGRTYGSTAWEVHRTTHSDTNVEHYTDYPGKM